MKQAAWIFAAGLFAISAAVPAYSQTGQGQAVVTVLPKHEGEVPANVANPDLTLKINGKNAKVTKWERYDQQSSNVELVVLIDSAARTSLGRQLSDIADFVRSLPPNVKATIGYMQNGRAVLSGPLSSDRAQVLSGLHIPVGMPGSNASPYFCLSDLAKSWPSQDPKARREVVMVTDGVDYYQMRFDPEDPYVKSAINDSVRAHLVVYSIYWMNQGRADRTLYENNAGQSLLAEVTESTGGKSFWEGIGNPVSFAPYLDELTRRLRNQYELRFSSNAGSKPEIGSMKLKLSAPGVEVNAPGEVLVMPAGAGQN